MKIVTFLVSSDDYDGHVYADEFGYNGAHNATIGNHSYTFLIDIGQMKFGSLYYINRGLLQFDTSSLPDNVIIISAKLGLYGKTDYSTSDFIINVQGWTDASDGIATDDYSKFDGTNYDDGNFNTASFTTSGYNNITFSDYSIINKTGNTNLCIRSNRDISSTAPINYETIYVYDTGESSGKDPQLYITYTLPYNAPLNIYFANSEVEIKWGKFSLFF